MSQVNLIVSVASVEPLTAETAKELLHKIVERGQADAADVASDEDLCNETRGEANTEAEAVVGIQIVPLAEPTPATAGFVLWCVVGRLDGDEDEAHHYWTSHSDDAIEKLKASLLKREVGDEEEGDAPEFYLSSITPVAKMLEGNAVVFTI